MGGNRGGNSAKLTIGPKSARALILCVLHEIFLLVTTVKVQKEILFSQYYHCIREIRRQKSVPFADMNPMTELAKDWGVDRYRRYN